MSYDVSFENADGAVEDNFNHTINCARMFCDAFRIAGLHETDGIRALHKKAAKDIQPYLQTAIEDMESRKEYYSKFNPENGWGSYASALQFIKDLEVASRRYTNSIIDVSW